MSTRNIVPRAHEEGNIGTSVKNWIKGWFKDIFISRYLTDGIVSLSIAQIAQGASYKYEESDGESTTSGDWIEKIRLSYTAPYTGKYLVQWACEVGNTNAAKQSGVRVQQNDTTILNESESTPGTAGEYEGHAGMKQITLTAAQAYTFDIDYKAYANTCKIRRARIMIRKVADD